MIYLLQDVLHHNRVIQIQSGVLLQTHSHHVLWNRRFEKQTGFISSLCLLSVVLLTHFSYQHINCIKIWVFVLSCLEGKSGVWVVGHGCRDVAGMVALSCGCPASTSSPAIIVMIIISHISIIIISVIIIVVVVMLLCVSLSLPPSFCLNPTGQGRWRPPRVRFCLRFLPVKGEFSFLAAVTKCCSWVNVGSL